MLTEKEIYVFIFIAILVLLIFYIFSQKEFQGIY